MRRTIASIRFGNDIFPISTFGIKELKHKESIYSAHIYVTHRSERELLADDIFHFIDSTYDEIGGFKSFKDMDRFISDSYLWYITYDGVQPDSLDEFDIGKVLVISVFRKNHGMKMVGFASNLFPDLKRKSDEYMHQREKVQYAIPQHIKFISKIGWAEVSDRLESWFHKVLGWQGIIDPELLRDNQVFKNISVDLDGLHYYRSLRNGEKPIQKIAYGTIKW